MTVLELGEESQSLRQAAKAWAKGDLDTADYRMIRRATLEGMLGLEPGSTVEADPPAGNPSLGHVSDDPTDDTEVVGRTMVGPPPNTSRKVLIGVAVVAVILLVLGFITL